MTPPTGKTSYIITPLGSRPFDKAEKTGNDHLSLKKAQLSFNGHLLSKLGDPVYRQSLGQCLAEINSIITKKDVNLRMVTPDPDNTELP
ncbi:hypothetical protein [Endozoicomonas sp. ONNA2]|uniref:hypothetical protein n=1 Tax=Endozoicomonas sp. ONNA2 TaxID=2828741 RepID=UPI002147DF8C|nr:hypothetical protein [Endozoicomonas sp. ONNA2]